jgi:hypothetical protein
MKAGLSAPNHHATLPDVDDEPIKRIPELLRERNALDAEIAAIMHQVPEGMSIPRWSWNGPQR